MRARKKRPDVKSGAPLDLSLHSEERKIKIRALKQSWFNRGMLWLRRAGARVRFVTGELILEVITDTAKVVSTPDQEISIQLDGEDISKHVEIVMVTFFRKGEEFGDPKIDVRLAQKRPRLRTDEKGRINIVKDTD